MHYTGLMIGGPYDGQLFKAERLGVRIPRHHSSIPESLILEKSFKATSIFQYIDFEHVTLGKMSFWIKKDIPSDISPFDYLISELTKRYMQCNTQD